MKKFASILAVLILVGTGCTRASTTPPAVNTNTVATYSRDTEILPDTQWKTVSVGGVVSVQIPPQCNGLGAAGSTHIVCPQPNNENPIDEMVISSDGSIVNIRHGANLESPYWDAIIESLKVSAPLQQGLQINIEK